MENELDFLMILELRDGISKWLEALKHTMIDSFFFFVTYFFVILWNIL